MSEALALIESAMRADAEALRVISHNIANAQVVGYRRQIAVNTVQPTFDAATAEAALQVESAGTLAPATHIATDSRAGAFKATGRALDIALESGGYLVVQGTDGPVLTRRGDLQVSPQGWLVTAGGEIVLGEQGPITVGSIAPVIESDGSVRLQEQIIDRLRLAQVVDESQLQAIGNGLFADPASVQLDAQGQALVQQGFLEQSNLSPVGEMVQMMEVMRHFEASQRFVRGYDQMMEKAISELGKVG